MISDLAITNGPTYNEDPANFPQLSSKAAYYFTSHAIRFELHPGEWLNLPLALEGARRGRGGIMTVLLIAGEGLLGCGLGMRCLLHCWRAHLNTASSKHNIKTSPLNRIKIQAYGY